MKIDRQNLILAAIIIFVVVLIYHPWFSNQIIARGDWKAFSSAWMLDYLGSPSVWNEADYGGFSMLSVGALARFPLLYIQANLHKIFGLGFAWLERIIWFFPFLVVSIISIYLLSKYLFKDTLISFFSTIYFIANNFIIFRLHTAQMNLAMTYALAPLSIYFFIRSLEERKLIFAFLNAVILSISAYYDFRTTVLVIVLEIAYGLYRSLILTSDGFGSFLTVFRNLAFTGIIVLFLNAFWLLPTAMDFQSALPSSPSLSSLETLKSLSRTDFFNALVLSIGADSKKGGFIYLDDQIIVKVLPLLLVIIYGFSLLARPRREYMFWFVSSVILAFFAKGLNPPFSSINILFYKYVPLAAMFRLPTKFLMVGGTSISFCFGLGCAGLLSRVRSRDWYYPTLVVLLMLPVLFILPALFGSKSLKSMRGGSSFNPFVATEYFEFEKWINQQSSGYRMLFLPGAPSYSFFSSRFPRYEPSLSRARGGTVGLYFRYRFGTLDALKSTEQKILPAILSWLNVKYIFIAPQDDTMWPWFVRGAYGLFKNMLSGVEEFKKTENENIFVLENPAPRFFISRKLVYLGEADFESAFTELVDSGVNLQALTFVDKRVDDALSPEEVVSTDFSTADSNVEFEKIGNAKYRIRILDPPKGKFYLNFQDSYDPNWRINNTLAPSLSAAGTNYFPLENVAGDSSLELILEHRMQRYVDLGWKITQTAWLSVLSFLVVFYGRQLLAR